MIKQGVIRLWKDGDASITLTRYERETDRLDRPAMIVVPGGGYSSVCTPTEGTPIADRFLSLGFNVFVLNYRVAPAEYPQPQQDLLRAVKLVRRHAVEWHVLKDNVAVVGFSAGGHLCASAGTLFKDIQTDAGDGADKESGRPDAMVLCYPVITFAGPMAHGRSAACLLGRQYSPEMLEKLSLERRVEEDSTPAFIWHTLADETVPVENSILMFEALRAKNVPVELEIHPQGRHGMQMGYGCEDLAHWPEQAKRFMVTACHFRFPAVPRRRTVILTFDDAVKNHLTFVAPLLRRHGFGATFFICRFPDDWRAKNSAALLTGEEVKKLHDFGFEIGNHSWGHPLLTDLTEEQICWEYSELNKFLADAGVPLPVTFAYPGGPYAERPASLLSRYGFKYARTVEERPFNPRKDAFDRIPAYPVQKDECYTDFRRIVEQADDENAVVVVFHGVPDRVHPWVNTEEDVFEKCVQYLADHDFTVMSIKDYLADF